ncbi:hypothetical protein MYXO_02296 [Myxococcaceae bacterium]|nr:hypothetical protein MYXO_02296 [Myxococcaceae bacterium]
MKRALLLALVCVGLLGSDCQGGAVGTPSLWLDPPLASLTEGSVVSVDVLVVTASASIQAYDLGVQVSPPILVPFAIEPHPDFDDDGVLFRPPAFDVAGASATGAVDVRHGAAASGTVRLLRVRLWAAASGVAEVRLSGDGIVGPDGSLVVSPSAVATIQVTPP